MRSAKQKSSRKQGPLILVRSTTLLRALNPERPRDKKDLPAITILASYFVTSGLGETGVFTHSRRTVVDFSARCKYRCCSQTEHTF